jgi:amidase
VTPTLGQLPAPHGTLDYDNQDHTVRSWLRRILEFGPFTAPFNVSGHPAISLPLGQSREGLPIGVQLVAAHGREDLLLGVAAQLEQAVPWNSRRPPALF